MKQTKEIGGNSQLKDDTKYPKLIAKLLKDGNFGMSYLLKICMQTYVGFQCSGTIEWRNVEG
ncbi:MAG: hypothetical protein SOU16_07055 [Faecalimonas sp.]|nr:hypothetical protein [Faecalimonas sp.]